MDAPKKLSAGSALGRIIRRFSDIPYHDIVDLSIALYPYYIPQVVFSSFVCSLNVELEET